MLNECDGHMLSRPQVADVFLHVRATHFVSINSHCLDSRVLTSTVYGGRTQE